jgi:ribose 1,5-bisphosphokinase PhnN
MGPSGSGKTTLLNNNPNTTIVQRVIWHTSDPKHFVVWLAATIAGCWR